MDRRQFFKSSALWLAGLLVAPHLKFAESMVVNVGRGSFWMLGSFGLALGIKEIPFYDRDSWGFVISPELYAEIEELYEH